MLVLVEDVSKIEVSLNGYSPDVVLGEKKFTDLKKKKLYLYLFCFVYFIFIFYFFLHIYFLFNY